MRGSWRGRTECQGRWCHRCCFVLTRPPGTCGGTPAIFRASLEAYGRVCVRVRVCVCVRERSSLYRPNPPGRRESISRPNPFSSIQSRVCVCVCAHFFNFFKVCVDIVIRVGLAGTFACEAIATRCGRAGHILGVGYT